MAEKATIARPYARAAFEYAHAHGRLAAWSEALALASLVIADPQVEPLLDDPRVSAAQLVELIDGIAAGRLDAEGRNFLSVLAHNRRLPLLPIIAAMYEQLRAEVENTLDVEVTSAQALDDAQRQRLAAALGKRFRRQVRLQEKVDASLVGGAVVRAGDLVIDGSLKGRLARLATELN
jgi:F-type H+-transporting ATPase subunit delta